MAIYPAQNLTSQQVDTVVEYTMRIGCGLGVRGLFNIQYVVFDNEVYVLEVNPRASRTVPFISKVTGVPLVKLAVGVMLGHSLLDQGYSSPWRSCHWSIPTSAPR